MKIRIAGLVVLATAMMSASAQAAAIFTAGIYSQNFDSITSTGTAPPTDWTAGGLTGSPSRVTDGGGAAVSQLLTVDNGSNGVANGTGGVIGKTYNYGTTGASDRAIGNIGTTTGGSGFIGGDHVLQVAMSNNTGAAIEKLKIDYTGEQWRYGQDVATTAQGPEKLRLYYSTSASSGWVDVALDFVAPIQDVPANPDFTPLDGNAAANRVVLSKTYTLPALLADGGTFYLRWLDWNDDGTNDHGLAVDDVTLTAFAPAPVPEPASLGILGVASLMLFRRSRRRD